MKNSKIPLSSRPLQSTQYKRAKQGFIQWLKTLGYSENTVERYPDTVHECLIWLETNKILAIKQLKPQHFQDFWKYLQTRPNLQEGGALSIASLNSYLNALRKFTQYLNLAHSQSLFPNWEYLKKQNSLTQRIVLNPYAIQALYQQTQNNTLGLRDRAMLAIYYACALRKSEGLALQISDILFERRLIYVRSPKNKHERYVPIHKSDLIDLENYLFASRPFLLGNQQESQRLFLSVLGQPIKGQALSLRLKKLAQHSNHPQLTSQSFGLHALRHSRATHLMQQGIDLEYIALFLGHKELNSTQIYTHLMNERNPT